MSTITRTTKLSGVLANMTSMVLCDPTGAYGIKRNDTGATVVAANTAMTNASTGTYAYTFTPVDGVEYTAWIKRVCRGQTSYREVIFTAVSAVTGLAPLEEAIYEILKADATIAALIETDRIYPVALSEGETPVKTHKSAITVEVVSGSDEVTIDTGIGPQEDRVQLTCWAETHDKCRELFAAVQARFQRLSGTFAGVMITETYIEGRGDVAGLGLPDEQFDGWGKYLDVVISY